MRVLIISPQPFFQWRGSPIRVRFDLLAFSEAGYQVDLLTLPFGEDETFDNVDIIRVSNPFGFRDISIGPSVKKIIFDLLLLFRGIILVSRNRYPVIHGIEEGGTIAILLAKLFRKKAVYEKHSDPSSYRDGNLKNLVMRVYEVVERWMTKTADLVICTGPGLAEQAKSYGGTTPVTDIFDIPSSIVEADETDIQAMAERLRQNEDEVLITYVGSFAVYQGVEMMFDMIPGVVEQCPRVRFIIIGGTEAEIERYCSVLREQSVDEAVTFLGKIPPDELPKYLAAADILITPRQAGINTPLKILDYFKAGAAIVATDIPSNHLLLNEKTALFSSPDAKSFGDKIVELVENPSLRKTLGDNGRDLYKNKYNFDGFKKRLIDAYKDMLGKE